MLRQSFTHIKCQSYRLIIQCVELDCVLRGAKTQLSQFNAEQMHLAIWNQLCWIKYFALFLHNANFSNQLLEPHCRFQRLTVLQCSQTGSVCLRGWPNLKPEVYTASGSLQIKTVIIVLGLDWALFEKMEGGWWGKWCHLWFGDISLVYCAAGRKDGTREKDTEREGRMKCGI